jgi:hypothetical protein
VTPEELHARLKLSGVSCRIKGGNILIEVCPYCGNDRHNMEISIEKGLANCWACRQPRPGRADTVISLLTGDDVRIQVRGDDRRHSTPTSLPQPTGLAIRPVDQVPSAQRYLARRGLDAAVCDNIGIGVCLREDHLLHGRITIPARDYWTGDLLGWVGRSYTNARPKYLSTVPKGAPVSGWRMPARNMPCIIVEGHLDGVAVWRAGFSAAVLGSVANPKLPDWAGRIPPETEVIIMLDGSAVNEARKLYWSLFALRGGGDRLRWTSLAAGQDPAGIGPEQIRELVWGAVGTSTDGNPIGGRT